MQDSAALNQRGRHRNPQFDLVRIFFATLVLLAHAPEITDGNESREILSRLTRSNFSFGALGVDGFFLLSGFLIVQSWQSDPNWRRFLSKRILRIVPGYVVAVLLGTLVVGFLAPGVPHFFQHLSLHLPASMLLLTAPSTPSVYPGIPAMSLNASLWTIAYEFRCYLVVLLFGVLGLLRYRFVWGLFTAFFVISLVSPLIRAYPNHAIYWITGVPSQVLRLSAAFFVGACFHLFRDKIVFRPVFAALAGLALVGCLSRPTGLELGLILFGGYLLFYVGQMDLEFLAWMKKMPDISYGVYLYGYPVEALWIWYFRGSPWIAAAGCIPICYILGWLSWHSIEYPMLRFKPRSVSLPAR